MFIAQGVLIGVIGTAIGLVLGYAISWAGGHYHFISLSPEVYSIDYVPFAPRLIDGRDRRRSSPSEFRLWPRFIPHGRRRAVLPAEALVRVAEYDRLAS